jgi:hypothetical protein
LLFLSKALVPDIFEDIHLSILASQDKMKERTLQYYYWPSMEVDISAHSKSCHQCQMQTKHTILLPDLISSPPQPTEPNQRVHANLFGPLKMSKSGEESISCITDTLTKHLQLISLPTKESAKVSVTIFNHWICCFGVPIDLVIDQAKEFYTGASEDLFKHLGTAHLKTTAGHSQTNSQAEVANKTITKYLISFFNKSTLDWGPTCIPDPYKRLPSSSHLELKPANPAYWH